MENVKAIEAIKERRSVRKFKDEIVSKAVMDKIMDATRYAPSWGNYQVARYSLITSQEVIGKMITQGMLDFAYNIGILKEAKNVAIVSVVTGKSGKLDLEKAEFTTSKAGVWEVFDAGISCQTFCVAAHAYGVGSVIMGVIDDKELARVANLPEGETVAAVIVYGYPDEDPKAPPRKAVEEITRYL